MLRELRVTLTCPVMPRADVLICAPGFGFEIPVLPPARCVGLNVLNLSKRN